MSIHAPKWLVRPQSARKTALLTGTSGPRFTRERFGSSFHENLSEWFKPTPPRIPGSGDLWKKDLSLRSSQAIALAIHTSGVILIFLVLQHLPGGVNSPPNGPEL